MLSTYYETIPDVPITGIFDSQTRKAVIEFHKIAGLSPNGNVTPETYRILYDYVFRILNTLPSEAVYLPYLR